MMGLLIAAGRRGVLRGIPGALGEIWTFCPTWNQRHEGRRVGRAVRVYMASPIWEEEEVRRRARMVMIGGILEGWMI